MWRIAASRQSRAPDGVAEGGGGSPAAPEMVVVEMEPSADPQLGDLPAPGSSEAAPSTTTTTSPAEPAAKPAEAKPSIGDWRDRRIAKLTAQLREAQSTLATKVVENPSAATAAGLTEEQIRAAAEPLARQIAAQNAFNEACNAVADAGRKAFEDFEPRVMALRGLIGDDQEAAQKYNALLEVVIKTGKGAEILHELGGDLNEASRLLDLSPADMIMEVSRKAFAAPSVAPVTAAPRPLATQVGGRGQQHDTIAPDDPSKADNMAMDEWMRKREAQVAEREKSRRRA